MILVYVKVVIKSNQNKMKGQLKINNKDSSLFKKFRQLNSETVIVKLRMGRKELSSCVLIGLKYIYIYIIIIISRW